jgi:NDP-sugar pyrophosphorylase family protein
LVTNGDVLTTLPLPALIECHRWRGAVATIASSVKKVKIDLGVIGVDGDNLIKGYTEKPTYEFLVSMGIYVFEPKVLSYVGCGERLDFPDLVLRLIAAGERVVSYPYEGYWMDLGRVEDYERAVKDFEALKAEFLGEPLAVQGEIEPSARREFEVQVGTPSQYEVGHPGGNGASGGRRGHGTAYSAG